MGVTLARDERPGTLGPGFLAGASANDPTTVGTIAAIGASSGYALLPFMIVVLPMLAAVQAIAATVGGVCGMSVQGAVVRRYGTRAALISFAAIAIVNVVTLIADLQAGSEALGLLTGLPYRIFVVPFALLAAWILLKNELMRVERLLTLVPALFLAYVASAVLARPDLGTLARESLATLAHFTPALAVGVLALFGTTLTSYVYVWESMEVAARRPKRGRLGALRIDAAVGIAVAGATMIVIMIASAARFSGDHVAFQSTSDIAAALRPLAGPLAAQLFGIGLFASALLAVPILAKTTAQVAHETFGGAGAENVSIGRPAGAVATTIIASIAVAAVASMIGFSLPELLIAASIVGGIATPISLVFLMLVARDRSLMGDARIGSTLCVAGWATVAVTTLVGVAAAVVSHWTFVGIG